MTTLRAWVATSGIVFALALFAAVASAAPASVDTTLDELIDQQRLDISTRLLPATDIVAGQKLALEITIATDRWFKGGTRIRLPEVPGLVILQTEQFANNASEQRQGTNWVVQRWSVDVYPQREGTFLIPQITLELSVAGEGLDVIAGTALTDSLTFSAAIPPGLTEESRWVAAPAFSVSQRFDRDVSELAVGDALEQTIVFAADNVMAMMLPGYEAPILEGLKGYPLPPQLSDSSNRGQASAQRVETISYIAQAPGDFLLPAMDFYWWNTASGELTLMSLPPVTVVVTGAAAPAAKSRLKPGLLAAIALMIIVIAGGGWLAYRAHKRWLSQLPWKRLIEPFQKVRAILQQLRQPALPQELNPDNSAVD